MTTDIQDIDFSVDVLKALLWQYNDATNLRALLEAKQTWYDENQKQFWEDWVTNVFDLRTANDFGLSVWSIILGQSLYTTFVPSVTTPFFGFGTGNENFGVYNFGSLSGGNNVYSTETSRILLRLRYFQLTSSGTIPETNRMLKYIFGDMGNGYIVDNQDMSQTYMFGFTLSSELRFMLENTDILPRPAGVKSTIVEF
jgi:hypothetical protein